MIETKHSGYYAGEDGHIYSTRVNKGNSKDPLRLKSHAGSSGYLQVNIKHEDKFKSTMVHSLICETFHGPRPIVDGKRYTCSHLDGNINNNIPSNLIWESHSDNHRRKWTHGTDDSGWKNSRAKLSQDNIEEIRIRLKAGETHQSIADDFNVARATISKINNGSRYGGL